jgi:hypothetical protein
MKQSILPIEDISRLNDLLQVLNNEEKLSKNYRVLSSGGGKDGIPIYSFIHDTNKDELIIWTKGTRFTHVNDVKISINCRPVEFLNGSVHRGYYYAGKKIVEKVNKFIVNKRYRRIITLGHSLGAGTSCVAAVILRIVQGRENVFGLTFACPPVFNSTVSAQTKNFIVSFYKRSDPVPKLANSFMTIARFKNNVELFKRNAIRRMPKLGKLIGSEEDIEVIDFDAIEFPSHLPGAIIILNDAKGPLITETENSRPDLYENTLLTFGWFNHTFDSNYHKRVNDLCVAIKNGRKPEVHRGTDSFFIDLLIGLGNLALLPLRVAFFFGEKIGEIIADVIL